MRASVVCAFAFSSCIVSYFGGFTASRFSFLRPSLQQSAFHVYSCFPSLFLFPLLSSYIPVSSRFYLFQAFISLHRSAARGLSSPPLILYVLSPSPTSYPFFLSVSAGDRRAAIHQRRVFNRPLCFVRWHLGALVNICYMWFSKGGAETRQEAARPFISLRRWGGSRHEGLLGGRRRGRTGSSGRGEGPMGVWVQMIY